MAKERRLLRIGTTSSEVEGYLRVHADARTLDHLNRGGARFLELEERGPKIDGHPFAVGISTILWVVEKTPFQTDERRVEAERYGRMAVRVDLEAWEIHGYLHIAGEGDFMTRLNREGRPFIALTTASVSGPAGAFSTPFLMVNRERVVSVWPRDESESDADFLEVVAGAVGRDDGR